MDLRRLRIRLTILYTVLSAIAIITLAFIAARSGTARIYESAEREVADVARDAVLSNAWEAVDARNDTWMVNPTDEWINGPENAIVEPPYFSMASAALDADDGVFRRFQQDGEWLAFAMPFDDASALMTALDLSDFDDDANSLRLGIGFAAVAAIAAVAVIGWFVAGRSLRPARDVLSQQQDFLADAAHELRTPMAVVQASSSHALSRERSADEYRASLSEIHQAATRAAAGVNELLEFARLESGDARPRRNPLRSDLLIEEVAASIRADGVTLEADAGPASTVLADYALLRQALETVTRNAVARARHVVVSNRRNGRFVELVVSDDGPGFAEDVLPHVFERFRRGDRAGSSGLGMAIAHRIVTAHHGTTEARNRPEGGAEVIFRLPAIDDR
ncbi:MAG: HAMP domain-containing sensor histidine kinase [Actinomycetota bacterium]